MHTIKLTVSLPDSIESGMSDDDTRKLGTLIGEFQANVMRSTNYAYRVILEVDTQHPWEGLLTPSSCEDAIKAELLEALEGFVSVCDTAPPTQFIKLLSNAVEKARAAIAKARGTTNHE